MLRVMRSAKAKNDVVLDIVGPVNRSWESWIICSPSGFQGHTEILCTVTAIPGKNGKMAVNSLMAKIVSELQESDGKIMLIVTATKPDSNQEGPSAQPYTAKWQNY